MLAIVGTVPDQNFPLITGEAALKGDTLFIQGRQAPVNRGTPALIAAAIKINEIMGQPLPFAYLVGDIGLGDGSRDLYAHLCENLSKCRFNAIVFHYLQPDVDWHNRVLFAIREMTHRPMLIADAGFMYAAKMSGQATDYDLFTPDVGELAFLADEEAPHPFYTRGFILHEDNQAPALIARAYAHKNAAKSLLVKGQPDYLADLKGIRITIDQPIEKAMEAIGGTGDTLTGIVAALIGAGIEINEAAAMAARVNRLAGHYAEPTPATQIMDIIRKIPVALTQVLDQKPTLKERGHV